MQEKGQVSFSETPNFSLRLSGTSSDALWRKLGFSNRNKQSAKVDSDTFWYESRDLLTQPAFWWSFRVTQSFPIGRSSGTKSDVLLELAQKFSEPSRMLFEEFIDISLPNLRQSSLLEQACRSSGEYSGNKSGLFWTSFKPRGGPIDDTFSRIEKVQRSSGNNSRRLSNQWPQWPSKAREISNISWRKFIGLPAYVLKSTGYILGVWNPGIFHKNQLRNVLDVQMACGANIEHGSFGTAALWRKFYFRKQTLRLFEPLWSTINSEFWRVFWNKTSSFVCESQIVTSSEIF